MINNGLLADVVIRAAKIRDGETDGEALDRIIRLLRCHLYAYSSWGFADDWTSGHCWILTDKSLLVVDGNGDLSVRNNIDPLGSIKIVGGYYAIGRSLQNMIADGRLEQWAKDIFDYLNARNEVEVAVEPAGIEVESGC